MYLASGSTPLLDLVPRLKLPGAITLMPGAITLMLVLSACISTRSIDVPVQPPADVEDRVVVNGEPLPLPDDTVVTAEPLMGEPVMSPVVKSLLADARRERQTQNWDGAASLLERALRIEPRNATLWARLAEVRYDQKAWKKSIQLAAKSNTLAKANENLRRQNWVLMAGAYEASGDTEQAQKYREKLAN